MRIREILGISLAALVLAAPAGAQQEQTRLSFEGKYDVTGQSPSGPPYKGEAAVRKTGQTYTVVWVIGQQIMFGTGVLNGSSLSVAFQSQNVRGAPGVVVLHIVNGQLVGGVWSQLGMVEVMTENWKKVVEPTY
jgi:hypothetical protein